MPTTVRLHRTIASTPETVDSALLELEGTPAPSRRPTYLARFGWTATITPMSVGPDRHIINPMAG
jgi:hypothetical protein